MNRKKQWIHWVILVTVISLCCSSGDSAASEKQAEHNPEWAFQPVQDPELPFVENDSWAQQPMDRFILAKLESAGMQPAQQANKRTLIRRLSFDLLGFPPSAEDVEAFANDSSADAYAYYVEKYLASPQFGERWGRHWLDVARYADSKGYVFQEERKYPFAYTYRDYVVRSFNEDKPFDVFLLEQLAADQLEPEKNPESLAALGFLTLGRRFLNNQHDIIDDRIDVVTRGLMGLTVACARCHDHKYDPIPIDDYYSLYGVFASSYEPGELPLLAKEPPNTPEYRTYIKERERRIQARVDFLATKEAETRAQLRSRAGEFLAAAQEAKPLDGSEREDLARKRQMDPTLLNRWVDLLNSRSNLTDPEFGPWKALSILASGDLVEKQSLMFFLSSEEQGFKKWNPLVLKALGWDEGKDFPVQTLESVADVYGKVLSETDSKWTQFKEQNPEALAFTDAHEENLRGLLYASGSPFDVSQGHLQGRVFDVAAQQEARRLQREIDSLAATHEGAPARGMAMYDKESPSNARILLRGNPSSPGPETPRQFLKVIAGKDRQPFQKGSGRLEMARAIASRENPLTARVMVNRVWLHLFGRPIVQTPSDFGTRSDPPTHPKLLDHLATQFMSNGWSVKDLCRYILLSSSYRQDSQGFKPEYQERDPDNLLVWKMNRKRLELEPLRDSLLYVSGAMNQSMGGRPVDIIDKPFTYKRTLYGFIDRQNLPNLFRAFDFANPDSTCPERFTTTAPQQTLYLMNHPFVIDLAKNLAQRVEEQKISIVSSQIEYLYQRIFQRSPSREEQELGKSFLSVGAEPIETESGINPLEAYTQALLLSNEFTFVD